MFIYNKFKKGFSLIELIVVMGIMAIIVLIAVPKFIGHTKQANLTKIKSSAKKIEDAADRYYLKNDNWPRATSEDDYYTKDELEFYAQEIYDKTGTVIHLEEDGHYYDIDYVALKGYVRVPDDSVKYIIQNPVGRVYYLDKLTPEGEQIFNDNKDDTQVVVTPTPIPEPELEPSDEGWFIIDEIGNVSASDTLKALPGPIDLIIPNIINGIESKAIAVNGFRVMKNINSVTIPNSVTSIGDNAFLESGLTSVTIGNNVKTIGKFAFQATNITSVVLPDSVETLGDCSFYQISTLTSIKLSNNLKIIGEFSFGSSTKVIQIDIPESVTSIGTNTFGSWTSSQTIFIKARNNTNFTLGNKWCGSANVVFEDIDDYFIIDANGSISGNAALIAVKGPLNLIIPDSINGIETKTITANGFRVMKNINSVTIPNSVTSIGDNAFLESGLTSVTIGNNVKTIGKYAFQATNITSVVLPDSVETLGDCSFYIISTLTNIKLSNNLKTIGDFSFGSSTKVTQIDIPESVTSIGTNAFGSWTSAQTIFIKARNNTNFTLGNKWYGSASVVFEDIDDYFIIDANGSISGNAALIAAKGPLNLIIPDSINGIETKTIANNGFRDMKNINSVIIPDSVTSIGDNAFLESGLTSVTIGNNVKTIGEAAFKSTKLTSVVLPDSVETLGYGSFYIISTLTNIKLSNNLKTIGNFSFGSATKVTQIEIPKSVTSIGINAFSSWTSAQTILIKARNNTNFTLGNTWYGSANVVFEDIDDYFIIDANGYTSGNAALIAVKGPLNLIIPDSINGIETKAIANNGFRDMKNINSVIIPDSVTSIGDNAFISSGLTSVAIGNNVKTIGEAAFQSTKLTSVVLPDSVETLGNHSFYLISTLNNIKLSNNLKTIGNFSFGSATKVAQIEIPKSVTSIGINTFGTWTSSQTIKFLDRTSTAGITLGSSWSGAAILSYGISE